MKVQNTIKSVKISSDKSLSGAYLEGKDFLMLILTDNKESGIAQKLYQTLNMVSVMYGAKVHILESVKRKTKKVEKESKTTR